MNTNPTATETPDKLCRECGQPFTCDFPAVARFVHVCPACSERADTEQKRRDAEWNRCAAERAAEARLDRWHDVCPPAYLETDPARLPLPHRLADVLAWRYNPQGLLLHGDTGTGKSRCVWQLLRREYLAGRSLRVLDCSAGIQYAAKFGDSTRAAAEWIERACRADMVLLDDTFKARLTDSFESALFTIIAKRGESRLPIHVTSNDDPHTLAARMTNDRSGPLIRRLREMTTPIAFTP